MEKIFLNDSHVEEVAERAAEVLRAGGVVLYPTDTLYGLGADALSDEAVAKVYAIKGRDEKKPIHAIVADVSMMERYAKVNDLARELAKEFLPGPLTLILKKSAEGGSAFGGKWNGFNTGIGRNMDTIGFRIPDNEFCQTFARAFGSPITTTSANMAGKRPEQTVDAVLAQLQHSNIPKNVGMIDLIVDAGELPACEPSTVVDLSGERPLILREGAIPAALIWDTLRSEL